MWVYRRLVDPRNFQPGTYPGSSGTTLVNWPQNDYWLGPLVGAQVSKADALAHAARAKQLSLSLLYWLQTECPRPDGKFGWKGLRLRADLVGTEDGLAKAPYIRESRRIKAEFTVLEQHVGTETRRKLLKAQDVQAESFADSVGVGSSLSVTRLFASLLFGVHASDALTMGTALLVLTAVAALACYVPARRATRVQPIIALRAE